MTPSFPSEVKMLSSSPRQMLTEQNASSQKVQSIKSQEGAVKMKRPSSQPLHHHHHPRLPPKEGSTKLSGLFGDCALGRGLGTKGCSGLCNSGGIAGRRPSLAQKMLFRLKAIAGLGVGAHREDTCSCLFHAVPSGLNQKLAEECN